MRCGAGLRSDGLAAHGLIPAPSYRTIARCSAPADTDENPWPDDNRYARRRHSTQPSSSAPIVQFAAIAPRAPAGRRYAIGYAEPRLGDRSHGDSRGISRRPGDRPKGRANPGAALRAGDLAPAILGRTNFRCTAGWRIPGRGAGRGWWV